MTCMVTMQVTMQVNIQDNIQVKQLLMLNISYSRLLCVSKRLI